MNSIIKTTIFAFGIIFLNQITAPCKNAVLTDYEKLRFTSSIPAEGNSWAINDWNKNSELIGKGGIKNWNETGTIIRTYFKVTQTGKLNVGILAKSVSGSSTIKISCGNASKLIEIENNVLDTVSIGTFVIKENGYHFIEIQGVKKAGEYFPEIQIFLIGGEVADGKVYFARDDFYWGRRGPSVHLNFQVPENTGNAEFFYNEITVPENNDVLGSYFMACGFAQGYFGIQVNSEIERRVLFSVWSP
ncbi:MAG TPA: DUF5077 domain-containing protein, partial [Draconibacterium sp.]|nr:DUF5077 domain-containing protein [Draconibacterium sp.]